jgi:hypothetical protein
LERIGAVRIAGSGVELAAAERPLSDRGRARGLAQLLIEAGLLARQRGRAIVLLVDEAQNMDRPAVGDLFHALQEAQNHTLDVTHPAGATVRAWLPLVVWVAGLPGLLRHLRDSGSSFAERSKLVPLGLLRPPDVRAALERFAAAGEAVFEADGLDLLVDAVGGYPYFLHVVGSQTWTAGTGSVITADEVETGRRLAQPLIAEFLDERLRALTDRQRRYMVAVASLPPGERTSGAVAGRLGEPVERWASTQQALVDRHGLLERPARGRVEMAIPQLHRHLSTGDA